jgi:hypothetical protein
MTWMSLKVPNPRAFCMYRLRGAFDWCPFSFGWNRKGSDGKKRQEEGEEEKETTPF